LNSQFEDLPEKAKTSKKLKGPKVLAV